MGFSLLAPLFLAGLAVVAVPILVHLTARDRRDVLRFPSLKFLTRLPYRQAKRQRLRHRFLFTLRTLAIVTMVLAFTRPFFDRTAATAPGGTGREVVIALDRSYSMAYGETWERAVEAVRAAVADTPAGSRLSLITFAEEAEIEVASTTDPQAVLGALASLTPGSASTRFAPALRLANEILLDSTFAERGVVLISDQQAAGWDRSSASDAAILSPDVDLAMPLIGSDLIEAASNVLIADAVVHQTQGNAGGPGPQMTVTARLAHRGATIVEGLPVSLAVETTAGEANAQAEATVDLPPSQSKTVRLGPIDLPSGVARATVRIGDDPLAADNVFRLAVTPRPSLPVLLIEAPDARPRASLYLREALTVLPR